MAGERKPSIKSIGKKKTAWIPGILILPWLVKHLKLRISETIKSEKVELTGQSICNGISTFKIA